MSPKQIRVIVVIVVHQRKVFLWSHGEKGIGPRHVARMSFSVASVAKKEMLTARSAG